MSAARFLDFVRNSFDHIRFGFSDPTRATHYVSVKTTDGLWRDGVVAFDPEALDFLLSTKATGSNWFSPAAAERIRYDRITEIRYDQHRWAP